MTHCQPRPWTHRELAHLEAEHWADLAKTADPTQARSASQAMTHQTTRCWTPVLSGELRAKLHWVQVSLLCWYQVESLWFCGLDVGGTETGHQTSSPRKPKRLRQLRQSIAVSLGDNLQLPIALMLVELC